MTRSAVALLAISSALGVSCTPNPTLYQWGAYEQTLHEAYKNPEAIPGFQAELLDMIRASEKDGTSPPPGIYAEYGYALYLNNQLDTAVIYFAKERDQWPESAVLMTTVIKRLEKRLEQEETDADGTSSQSDGDEVGASNQRDASQVVGDPAGETERGGLR